VGVHSRIEPLQYYFARFQLPNQNKIQYNRNLDFTKARHYVIGYDFQPHRDLLVRAEAYYQDLYKVAVRDDSSGIFSTISVYEGFSNYALVNKGNGTNYGLELSLEKHFSRNFYFNWNASLYQATYQTLDRVKRNTPYNGSFTAHVLAGREFMLGKRQGQHQLNFNCRIAWNGGKRYIPIDLEASTREGREVPDLNQAYVYRLNNYFRLHAYTIQGDTQV
jgi:outer membrane receptor protein involved in Fe transport